MQPIWFKSGYVTSPHLAIARSILEQKQQTRKHRVRDIPLRSDIATYGAVKGSRALISHLHDAREEVRVCFYQDLGYIMDDWGSFSTDIDQNSLEVIWNMDEESGPRYHEMRNLPQSVFCKRGEDCSEADVMSRDMLNRIYEKCPNMVLVVRQDVYVTDSDAGRQWKHSGGAKKHLRSFINVLEVALNFCVGYTKLNNMETFLRGHALSLRCVYVITVVFRELFSSFIPSADICNRVIPKPGEVQSCETSLEQLLPGKAQRSSLINSRCLRITQKEFEELNQHSSCDVEDEGNMGEEITEEDGIEASMPMGVANL